MAIPSMLQTRSAAPRREATAADSPTEGPKEIREVRKLPEDGLTYEK